MLIAILMTNTDESAFSRAHPMDGEKFSALFWEIRPSWKFEVFNVKDGCFPTQTSQFDGVLITGSPASVRDEAPWIKQLEQLVCRIYAEKTPMFGACFGHQVIATALGGKVGYNPAGWSLGTVQTIWRDSDSATPINLYAAHKEQVVELPDEAAVVSATNGCPIAGFAIGNHVLTTQYHPEMTPDFISALLSEMEKDTDPETINAARHSLKTKADRGKIRDIMVTFFESAR